MRHLTSHPSRAKASAAAGAHLWLAPPQPVALVGFELKVAWLTAAREEDAWTGRWAGRFAEFDRQQGQAHSIQHGHPGKWSASPISNTRCFEHGPDRRSRSGAQQDDRKHGHPQQVSRDVDALIHSLPGRGLVRSEGASLHGGR